MHYGRRPQLSSGLVSHRVVVHHRLRNGEMHFADRARVVGVAVTKEAALRYVRVRVCLGCLCSSKVADTRWPKPEVKDPSSSFCQDSASVFHWSASAVRGFPEA